MDMFNYEGSSDFFSTDKILTSYCYDVMVQRKLITLLIPIKKS